ncbi:MAG: abortive infection family protein [Nitrosotalea sp.]
MGKEIEIPRFTRLDIFQTMSREEMKWSGSLDDHAFLSRLYDLESMPSYDSRYKTASADIRTHTVDFKGDWDDYWIFKDKRFNLLECDGNEFVAFLCEMINPVVRPDEKEREALLKLFNGNLKEHGCEIVETRSNFGKLHYELKGVLAGTIDALDETRDFLSSENIQRQITRMKSNVEKDPELAIGTSKEFIETVSKTILDKLGEQYNNEKLPKLTRMVMDALLTRTSDSNPETSEILKRIDGSLSTLIQAVVELRNKHGTGHGGGIDKKILDRKYASLAVNSAATLGFFLLQLYQEMEKK